ncbi:unnamed protein product [Adineta steineri]|uniref:EGF-like domain-containing protein n=1 Tax=Adineta steineri TaxID=433720 RepID=A0A815ADG2_9BILA|nr:unnamed protein product [Adineta steineri]CAF1486544.1 unnamed protein product [Adineta steineri]
MTGSSIDEKLCHPYNDTGWSFEQLSTGGIKSSDLAHWNAPVNIIDEYEHFLLTNNDELRLSRFCNCTGKMYFGTQCQYTFDVIDESFEALLSSHFANLQSITVDEAITMEDADVTCYKRDASCNGGCLDWRQICNGIADCNNGDDETSCGLLEYNECFMDEYRCRSGHCIPIMFAFDTTIDCADGSDEVELIYPFDRLAKCYRNIPNMFCDDHNDAWMMFPCGDGEIIDSPLFSCENQRHVRTLQQLYAGDVTLCWQYMICVQYLDFLFPLLVNCNDLCGESGDCLPTIPLACRDSTVIFPPKPVNVHPPVYFVYQTNMSERRFVPDFICYKQCDHLYPPSLKLHGYSCRSFTEFTGEPFHVLESFLKIFTSILHLFAGCINNIAVNHTSAIFHCPLTNRGISSHRIKDTFIDCHLSLDETFNGSTCALNLTQRFQCWTRSDECIPFRLVQDSAEQCSDHSDEVYPLTCDYGTEQACDYKRGLSQPTIPHYQFEDLCDGKESKSSLSWLLNGTDETDCEDAWCLLSPLTQCDGYWNCVDGRDELNCSLSSVSVGVKAALLVHNLSGCTMLEHFCLPVSSSSGNTLRPCLAVSRRGDGHIDCWGATDERCSFCNYTTISLEQHYRCAGDSNICIGWKKICNGHNDCPVGDDEKVCDWLPILVNESYFYCRNGTIIDRHDRQCNGRIDCENGEDEWFCDMRIPRSHDARLINFNEENYPVYPINLSNGIISHVHNIQIHRSVTSLVTSGWYCNRGFPIKNRGQRRCLCPPSYTGARCEIQRDRVSLFLQVISSASLQPYQHIKRIKFYLRACTSNLTRCFHDEVYLCFCPDENKRIPSCITYDHTRETCKEPSYCLNGGLCIENRRKGIVEFSCLCPACHYYGSLCQFSIGQQGISLDALVGVEIRTGRLLSEQSILIKLSMIILTSMIVIGFVGNTLATVTFARKKSRKAGCGWYLLVTSMSNQCTLVVFALRYIYLLVTQTVVWNNRTQSLILCQCLELGLAVLPNLSNWLSACVSVERTFTIARGALFNTSASVRTAKRLCIILPLIFTVMAIHEPMTRHLIEDPRLGRYTCPSCTIQWDSNLFNCDFPCYYEEKFYI